MPLWYGGALEHMADSGAKIYLQQCGSGHLYGQKELYPYEQSLAALFQAEGQKVYSLCFAMDGMQIPSEAYQVIQKGGHEIFTDLPTGRFAYDGDISEIVELIPEEKRYIKALMGEDFNVELSYDDIAYQPSAAECQQGSRLADRLRRDFLLLPRNLPSP